MNKTAINSNSSVTISKSEDDSPPRIVPITKPDHELKDEQIPSKSLQIDKIKVPKDG